MGEEAASGSVHDADGDGWSAQDGDCDDSDGNVHPGTSEVNGNAIDENCDGTHVTQVLSVASASIGRFDGGVTEPGSARCAGDGVAFLHDVTGDSIADVVVGASGCLSSNRPGRAYVLRGPLRGTVTPSDAVARIRSSDDPIWGGLGGMIVGDLGDLDGDGWPEIFYGAELTDGDGRLDIFSAPLSGDMIDADADASIVDDEHSGMDYAEIGAGVTAIDGTTWALTGWSDATGSTHVYLMDGIPNTGDAESVAAHVIDCGKNDTGARLARGDFDGDGIVDLAVGLFDELGEVALIPGPITSNAALADIGTSWLGTSKNEHLGEAIAMPGDVNTDGRDDLVIGAFFNSDLGVGSGAAYVVLGQDLDSKTRSVLDAELRIQSENVDDSLGDAVAGLGDLDGDGDPEVGITASRSADPFAVYPPARVYLMRSPPPSGVISAGDLDGALIGSPNEEVVAFGYGSSTLLAGGGDTDADGIPELLVGSPLVDGEYYEAVGRVDLIEGWPF